MYLDNYPLRIEVTLCFSQNERDKKYRYILAECSYLSHYRRCSCSIDFSRWIDYAVKQEQRLGHQLAFGFRASVALQVRRFQAPVREYVPQVRNTFLQSQGR